MSNMMFMMALWLLNVVKRQPDKSDVSTSTKNETGDQLKELHLPPQSFLCSPPLPSLPPSFPKISPHPHPQSPAFPLQIFQNPTQPINFNLGHQLLQSPMLNKQAKLACSLLRLALRPALRTPRALTALSQAPFSEKKSERMEFKAETKRLLDIVAKSLYTDSEVFVRELLSNASDALEKQRFKEQSSADLNISVELFPSKSQLVIQDNGIGMNRQSLIDHLGTIAKSGSKEFVNSLDKDEGGSAAKENIIGQFGVGFYSAFIVSDLVEVVSREEGQPANKWTSDGSGTFDIEQVEDDSFVRGTKIILHIKQDQSKFVQKTDIQQIVQKYSNFINFPITINGEAVNLVKPLWTRPKSELADKDYQRFYEFLTNGGEEYQYKLHFNSDVPLNLKTVLFVPRSHSEKYGLSQEKGEVSLYSKKILIKKDCKEVLLPNFLRFVKGVVDCEDIPLNISRETFQDSALMAKLRNFLTKRVLKLLRDEADKNPAEYQKWFQQFALFIKEGSIDQQFKKDVVDLNRYELNTEQGFFSLKDYVSRKKTTQDVIFYSTAPNRNVAVDNPYIFPLTKAGVPVLIANTHIEEIIFNEMDTYEGLKFANVETSNSDVERVLKGLKEQEGEKKEEEKHEQSIPADDITSFSLWIKNELQPYVDKVVVSTKPMMGPALVISPISSGMRQMAFMRQLMEQQAKTGKPRSDLRNITFEYDQHNELIVKLNEYRKISSDDASLIIRQLFDNACIESGLENDSKNMVKRINTLMGKILDSKTQQIA